MNKLIKNKPVKTIFIFLFLGFSIFGGISAPSSGFFTGKAYAQGAEYLVFGPYVALTPGKYEITFSLKVANNKTSRPVATLDVVAKNGQKSFASQELKGTDFKSNNTYQDFSLKFETTLGERDFEFRIRYFGGSKLWAEKIGITQLKSYFKEEAMGGYLIRGYTKDNVVAKAESFLKKSKYREIKINDPKFSRRIGYLVSDPKASSGQAWLVEPWMIRTEKPSAKAPLAKLERIAVPQVIKERSFLYFILGFIAGGLFVLAGAYIYLRANSRGLRVLNSRRRLKVWLKNSESAQILDRWDFPVLPSRRVRKLRLSKRKIFQHDLKVDAIEKWLGYITRKHLVVLTMLAGIVFSLFFDDVSPLFGISTLGGYLIVLYIILSIIWKLDSRIYIAVALLFLVACPFLLVTGQGELAEEAAIYAYYFLVLGVGFQVKEYFVEAWKEKKEKAE